MTTGERRPEAEFDVSGHAVGALAATPPNTPEELDAAADRLARRYPGVRIVSPSLGEQAEAEIVVRDGWADELADDWATYDAMLDATPGADQREKVYHRYRRRSLYVAQRLRQWYEDDIRDGRVRAGFKEVLPDLLQGADDRHPVPDEEANAIENQVAQLFGGASYSYESEMAHRERYRWIMAVLRGEHDDDLGVVDETVVSPDVIE